MLKISLNLKFYLVGFLLIFMIVVPTYAQDANGSDTDTDTPSLGSTIIEIVDGKEVLHEVRKYPSSEDADWPIVYSETVEKIDTETGEKYIEKTIIRRQKHSSNASFNEKCPQNLTGSSSCGPGWPTTVERERTSNNITAHIKHYAIYYCVTGSCTVFDPYKVERWWTRTTTSYTVQNATLSWGCSACAKCPTGDWSYVYNSSPITPGWNNLNSYVYTTSISWFEPMEELAYGGYVNAISSSNQVTVDAPLR